VIEEPDQSDLDFGGPAVMESQDSLDR
jgi:hypothetical protein